MNVVMMTFEEYKNQSMDWGQTTYYFSYKGRHARLHGATSGPSEFAPMIIILWYSARRVVPQQWCHRNIIAHATFARRSKHSIPAYPVPQTQEALFSVE